MELSSANFNGLILFSCKTACKHISYLKILMLSFLHQSLSQHCHLTSTNIDKAIYHLVILINEFYLIFKVILVFSFAIKSNSKSEFFIFIVFIFIFEPLRNLRSSLISASNL